MKPISPRRLRLFLAAALATLAGTASAGAAAAPAAPPAPTLQQQIEALLKHRMRPEPLPVDPPNPFVLTTKGGRETVATDTTPKPAAPEPAGVTAGGVTQPTELLATSPEEILAAVAVRLKIGGMLRRNDQVNLMINDVFRKEGDFISTVWNGSPVHIRIVRILPAQLILRLDNAEVTLKF
jgi:hypothetical protein